MVKGEWLMIWFMINDNDNVNVNENTIMVNGNETMLRPMLW